MVVEALEVVAAEEAEDEAEGGDLVVAEGAGGRMKEVVQTRVARLSIPRALTMPTVGAISFHCQSYGTR